jgi:hypothetical protein
MFDRIQVGGRTNREYVPYEKAVHEHKAPTDDSVRLYGEMQRRCREELVRTLKTEGNTLKASMAVFYDVLTLGWVVQAEVTINGNRLAFSWQTERDAGDREIVMGLYQEVANRIAKQMIQDLLPHLIA